MKHFILMLAAAFSFAVADARHAVPCKPRILISTDIGGTDADDNQSMAHLLMMNEQFDIEGLVSSPSFGDGSKEELLRMIDLYEKDFPVLKAKVDGLAEPNALRQLCKQGRRGRAPWCGYAGPTEGSRHIVECARRDDSRPLWILVWGALEDVAQALHDAPDIAGKIRIYWIGGPNKKWGCNAYTYMARNFPDLTFIENNASYRGFISDGKQKGEWQGGYYDCHIRGGGHLGADFINYYGGNVKMGDTPSLLYMMDGDPEDPTRENWGGAFERMTASPYRIYDRMTTSADTVSVYSIFELRLKLPANYSADGGQPPFVLLIDKQRWEAERDGGYAAVRYSPKAPAVLSYEIISEIPEFNGLKGQIVADGEWPGRHQTATDLPLGGRWFTDKADKALFNGPWQGFHSIARWREDVLRDWAVRWEWLKDNPTKTKEKSIKTNEK